MKLLVVIVSAVTFLNVLPVFAQELPDRASVVRPAHTYSIVARDPETGQIGVAVQSHWFSIGTLVPWAEAGVGAVVTQSFVEARYGASGLDLMRAGWNASRALDALRTADEHPEIRQVAMIDASGEVAAFTGKGCIPHAGHRVGSNFSVQANLMLNDGVLVEMEKAFLKTGGSLAERMLAALQAAQSGGGDLRGRQSAALVVVRGKSSGRPWEDRIVDLRVDDQSLPVQELARLLRLHQAYDFMNRGDLAIERDDVDGALREYSSAQRLVPDNTEMKFWHAASLVNAGRVDEALPIFRQVFAEEPNWRLLVPRMSGVKLLPADPAMIDRIISIEAGEQPLH